MRDIPMIINNDVYEADIHPLWNETGIPLSVLYETQGHPFNLSELKFKPLEPEINKHKRWVDNINIADGMYIKLDPIIFV